MSFNEYIWGIYKIGDGAEEIKYDPILFLNVFSDDYESVHYDYDDYDYEEDAWKSKNSIACLDYEEEVTVDFNLCKHLEEIITELNIDSLESAEKAFIDFCDNGFFSKYDIDGENYCVHRFGGKIDKYFYHNDVVSMISEISLGFHNGAPEYFVPYFFERHFDKLIQIFNLYAIDIPPIPGKRDKRGRALYYLEVNRVLQKYRENTDLTPAEFNAFLYDFSVKSIKNMKKTLPLELPLPSKVWLVIGFGDKGSDIDTLTQADSKSIFQWQGKPEMKIGDLVLMYCKAPFSSFHSFWRVVDNGFNDPYAYFYGQVRIGHKISAPHLHIRELKSNPLLKEKGIVRGSFQNGTGTSFYKEEFEEICELMKNIDPNYDNFPEGPTGNFVDTSFVQNEKDVEEKILEPFLCKIGIKEKNWVRQLPLKMGRSQCYYPDYLLGVRGNKGEEIARTTIECKYLIKNDGELTAAFKQAFSYAMRLSASQILLVDREGVRVFLKEKDGYIRDRFQYYSWQEIDNPDLFNELKRTIMYNLDF